MVSREVSGMCIIALAGISHTITVTASLFIKRIGIPFFALAGSALLMLSLGLAIVIKAKKEALHVRRSHWWWIWARGFFGTSTRTLTLMAVAYGAPLGECQALQSINIVVAAIWGRLFLGERIRCLHGIAVLFAVVGAFLVSKPDVLLGLSRAEHGVPWLGYMLSLLAGTAAGATFIATRKSQDLSASLLNWSLTMQQGAVLWLLSLSGFVDDVPLSAIGASPLLASLVFAGLLVLLMMTIWCFSAGAQLCPAAVSSTVYTSMCMALGFLAQIALQNNIPDLLPLGGASLLLAAVVLMSFARWLYLEDPPKTLSEEKVLGGGLHGELAGGLPSAGSSVRDGTEVADDEAGSVGSLASYVASEFSGISQRPMVRRRALPSSLAALPCQPPLQILGVAATA